MDIFFIYRIEFDKTNSPAHGIVTKTVHKDFSVGGGVRGW